MTQPKVATILSMLVVWTLCLGSTASEVSAASFDCVGIPMMSISHSDLMPISSERSDAGLFQSETMIDISQVVFAFSTRNSIAFAGFVFWR